MVFIGDRRTEKGEDPVAGGLRDVAAVAPHRLHHQLDRGIDDGASCLGVEVFDQLHRAPDVGEHRSYGLALSVEVFGGGGRASYSNLGLVGLPCCSLMCFQDGAALAAESFRRLNSSAALRTLSGKRRTALSAEYSPFSIVGAALRAAHRPSPARASPS